MDDLFVRKVQTAASAGWWTLLPAYIVLSVQWLFYLYILSNRPDWVLKLMGEGLTWPTCQSLWLWGIVIFKLCVLLMTVVVLWLTLWGRKLSRLE